MCLHVAQVLLKKWRHDGWQHGHPVFHPLALAHGDLVLSRVHVLDAQLQAFRHLQTAAVQQFDNQPVGMGQNLNDADRLVFGQNGRQATLFLGWNRADCAIEFYVEHLTVEKAQGVERLVLGGGCHALLHGQVGEKGLFFWRGHVAGMTFVVKEDKAGDPVDVGLFGAR